MFSALGYEDAIDQNPSVHHLSSIQSELLLLDMKQKLLQLVGNKILIVHLQQHPAERSKRQEENNLECQLQSNKMQKTINHKNKTALISLVDNHYLQMCLIRTEFWLNTTNFKCLRNQDLTVKQVEVKDNKVCEKETYRQRTQ